MKLILGTSNLGQKYGLTNGNFDINNSISVLKRALELGIKVLDTAPGYGKAELIIGQVVGSNSDVKVITKIPPKIPFNLSNILASIEMSQKLCSGAEIYGILFHDPKIATIPDFRKIVKDLFNIVNISRIGVSVYDFEEILQTNKICPEINFYQVPENILDQRLINSKFLLELSEREITFITRSTFLQGAILGNEKLLGNKLPQLEKYIKEFRLFCENINVRPIDVALSYACSIPWSSGTIVAANSIKQLDDIMSYTKVDLDFSVIKRPETALLDPRKWKLK